MSAGQVRRERGEAAFEEYADAFGGVELMPGEREEVHLLEVVRQINLDLSGCLDGIRVEQRALGMREA